MTNHEIGMEAYYYSINNELIGGISKKNAVKFSCILYFVAIIVVPERFYCSTVQGILSFISIFLFFNRGFEKENVEEDGRANLPDLPIQK